MNFARVKVTTEKGHKHLLHMVSEYETILTGNIKDIFLLNPDFETTTVKHIKDDI